MNKEEILQPENRDFFSFKLDSGPCSSFSFANSMDCKRYSIEHNTAHWGQKWVREKFKLQHPKRFGLLDISANGFFFEIYAIIQQPFPFHNVILAFNKYFPFHLLISRQELTKIRLKKADLDQVLCLRGLQFLPEKLLRHFLEQACIGLKQGATLAVNYAVLFNLNKKAISFFKENALLKKNKTTIPAPGKMLTMKMIKKIAPGFELANGINANMASRDIQEFENMILTTKGFFIKNLYKDLFLSVYTDKESEQMKDAKDVVVTNAGFYLRKTL